MFAIPVEVTNQNSCTYSCLVLYCSNQYSLASFVLDLWISPAEVNYSSKWPMQMGSCHYQSCQYEHNWLHCLWIVLYLSLIFKQCMQWFAEIKNWSRNIYHLTLSTIVPMLKLGNPGKHDSKIVLMAFLQKIVLNERIMTFKYKFFNLMQRVTSTARNFENELCMYYYSMVITNGHLLICDWCFRILKGSKMWSLDSDKRYC